MIDLSTITPAYIAELQAKAQLAIKKLTKVLEWSSTAEQDANTLADVKASLKDISALLVSNGL